MKVYVRIPMRAEHMQFATAAVFSVADSGGVRGVQMYPPLAASNVFLRT